MYRLRALVYYFLCWSTIALLVPGGQWWVLAVALLTTAPLVVFFARRGWRRYPTAAFRLFVVRPVLYVQLTLPLVSLAGIVGAGIGALVGSPLIGGRIGAATVLGVLLLLFAFGYVGSKLLVLRDVRVTIPELPSELDGLVIAQISDLHVGPQTSQAFLRRIARTVAGIGADVIAVTGDLVDGATVVALAHNPALWPALAAKGVDLTLSGHTHWGQFAIPRLGWSLASPFQTRAMGAHRDGDRMLYIHPGTGYWGLPFRLGAQPEVTRITLARGSEASITMAPARATSCGAVPPRQRSAPRQEPSPA